MSLGREIVAFEKFISPADSHLDDSKILENAKDCLRLYEIHSDPVYIQLAISHLMNMRIINEYYLQLP